MSSYPLLDAFLTIFWFTLMALWFVILIVVILEIFHNRDIGGWGKAGWLLLVILLQSSSTAKSSSCRAEPSRWERSYARCQ
jgi:hypothetical protein